MSYARKADGASDVYIVRTGTLLVCLECSLLHPAYSFVAENPGEMVEHLAEHRAHGHRVPEPTIERLVAEAGHDDQEQP